MPDPVNENALENRHYISLVLRLTLDQRGRLIQGELVDMTNTPWHRFTTLADLNQAVEAWLRQQVQAEEPTDL